MCTQDAASLDVSSAVVDTAFRSTPWQAEAAEAAQPRSTLRVLFVSESGVCRAVLAAAAFTASLEAHGLAGAVECDAAASRDYCVGQGYEGAVTPAAQAMGVPLPENYAVRLFEESSDIVRFDLVLVMDKYTAADVLREVSVFETVNPAARYSMKVRRLGEFHPRLGAAGSSGVPDGEDIDDPLYGNLGSLQQLEAVTAIGAVILESCQGLAARLAEVQARSGGEGLRGGVTQWLQEMDGMDWLVPPMLQTR